MLLRGRRWCATAPRFNNCVEGGLWHRSLCGARGRGERWACEIDLRGARTAPAACAALCAAAGGRRAAADVDRLLVAIFVGGDGRCWRRRGSAPRAGAALTGHRAAACDQHDTRRHTATSMMHDVGRRPRRAATGSWKTGGIERSALIVPVNHTRADSSRVRVRELVLSPARQPYSRRDSSRAREGRADPAPFRFSEIRLGANAGARAVAANADDAAAAGGVRQHPGSTTALRGLMASLALPSARPWRAMGMRDRPAGCASCATRLCGALCGGGRPPRGGRRRSFVGGDRLLVANGRCWGRRGSAPRAGDDGPPRGSVRPTRHSPPHGDIADAAVAAAAAGRAARFSYGVLAKAWFPLRPPR